ncbi:response regulator transcription factor [Cellulomonas pakistanensis]|uniref:response regulator transcription factor n=1 Tax=Cellulomonas pakistanensis TaxID=992287 RepID=UPI001943E403|nr:response regulator transcription factor [Cellulomonas pakistanensis]
MDVGGGGRTVRVALVVDEALPRAALAQGIEADDRITVVHRLPGRRAALDRVEPRTVDVLVVEEDLADGTGVELGLLLQERDPELAVLLLTGGGAADVALALRDRAPGSWSHVSRRRCPDPAALARAVVAAADGQVVLGVSPAGDDLPALTPARRAVLALVAQGLSNGAVGRALGLSPRSVENHLTAVYRALGVGGPDVSPRVLAALTYRARGG